MAIAKIKTENLDKKVAQKEEEAKQAKVTRKTETKSSNKVVVAVRPVNGGRITSRFGERSSIRSSSHTGLDIASPSGTPIKAAASGTVTFSGYKGSYGYLVKIFAFPFVIFKLEGTVGKLKTRDLTVRSTGRET